MLKKYIIFFFIIVGFIFLFSDIPPGYYDSAQGLSGDSLKAALNDIIQDHIEFSYNALRDYILPDTDEDPDNPDNVILLYTGWSIPKDEFGGDVSDWNREHVWAKSHGDFDNDPPCGTDAHHIRPTDVSVNSARSNLDFDNGGTEYIDGDGPTGCYSDEDSWEPRDAVKGDVARMIFYMAVRYEAENDELDLVVVDTVNTSPAPEHGKLSTLYQWHLDDQPDDWENSRNDKVYSYQNNRNPFIDHPEYVNYIWGGDTPEDIFPPTISNVTALTSNTILVDFSENVDETTSETISNYSINNGIGDPGSAVRGYEGDNSKVLLTVNTLSTGITYTITINNVGDLNNNIIEANSQAYFEFSYIVEFINESFETGMGEWTTYNKASNKNWERINSAGSSYPTSVPDGSFYMYVNNYNGDVPGNDWLISPCVDLSLYSSPVMSFYLWTKYSDTIPGLEVKASVDYPGSSDDPTDFTWQPVIVDLPSPGSDTWEWKEDIDLSDYTNETQLYIAFHYTSTGTGAGSTTAWAVDKFVMKGLPGGPLPTPENVNIVVSESTITISWDEVAGATSYKIYSSAVPYADFSSWDFIGSVSGVTLWNGSVTGNKRFFVVTAE